MNYYRWQEGEPYHLSVGAVVVRDGGEICCHHFVKAPEFGFDDIYLLMRETIEPGETIEQTLHRGLKEEFGVKATIKDFLGSIVSSYRAPDRAVEKTTLYFLCQLDSIDASQRQTDDPEGSSDIEWHDPDFLIEKMKGQCKIPGRTDLDESTVVGRAKKL